MRVSAGPHYDHIAMKHLALALSIVAAALGWSVQAQQASSAVKSGIDRSNFDPSVRPQDDFFRFVNGGWLARTEIPARSHELRRLHRARGRAPSEPARDRSRRPRQATSGRRAPAQQSRRLLLSFMDEAHAEQLGLTPLQAGAGADRGRSSRRQISPRCIGRARRFGVDSREPGVQPDAEAAGRRTIVAMRPERVSAARSRLLPEDDAKFAASRQVPCDVRRQICSLSGQPDAPATRSARDGARDARSPRRSGRSVQICATRRSATTRSTLADARRSDAGLRLDALPRRRTRRRRPRASIVGAAVLLQGLARLLGDVPLAAWKAYLRVAAGRRRLRAVPERAVRGRAVRVQRPHDARAAGRCGRAGSAA